MRPKIVRVGLGLVCALLLTATTSLLASAGMDCGISCGGCIVRAFDCEWCQVSGCEIYGIGCSFNYDCAN
jgi:hypothetical protein